MSTLFLLDENLSPHLIFKLQELGYKAICVRDVGLVGAEDKMIVEWAQKNHAVILTGDKDFGELWYWYYGGNLGVIVLRLAFPSLEYQGKIMEYLHRKKILKHPDLSKVLIISSDHHHRIRISKKQEDT